jgi:hypothetical protein
MCVVEAITHLSFRLAVIRGGPRTACLADRRKPGRRPVIDEVAVVLATLEPPPERLGVTHWSSRLLDAQLGISHVWVGRIWRIPALKRPGVSGGSIL